MASIALSAAGSALGGAVLGPLGVAFGNVAGNMLGNSVDGTLFGSNKNYETSAHRLQNLQVQSSSYGKMIPVVYGKAKLAGNIIWAEDLIEVPATSSTSYRTKRGKMTSTHTDYNYFANFAVSICEGEIDEILNVWADTKLLNLNNYTVRVYKGSETQLPDPLIESVQGMDQTPAFRGQAYIVFERFPLTEFGNRIPNFSFEVSRQMLSNTANSAENLVKSLVIIPGSGEFVYDTKIQYKEHGSKHMDKFFRRGHANSINMHNIENRANSLLAIDNMMKTFPNLEWVSPVINWFANDLDAGHSDVAPGVEFKDQVETFPNSWQVGKLSRSQGYEISRDSEDRPNYGGTPSDKSILNFIDELKSRGLKVMLNPMLLVDTPQKPWRGRMTAKNRVDMCKFLGDSGTYTKFILHYAKLLAGKIDAFVIGSELIGLTSFRDEKTGEFTGVKLLRKLARKVKDILGDDVKVTYAADWSEYHHGPEGYYNLDELWSSDAIDFIGIDAYFPLTNQAGSTYDRASLIKAWDEGEGIEYYYCDEDRKKQIPLSEEYAWKNLKWWWENEHINPGDQKTSWVPKSKPIWFTEYGFPSIDSCSNQPNVFFDPLGGKESKIPVNSNGEVDFKAQRVAIEATEMRWKNSPMVANKFLWTWDARPYPCWPQNRYAWCDGGSYAKGHWVQGKLGTSNLVEIIKHLCLKVGYSEADLEFVDIDESIFGYIVDQQSSAIESLEILAKAFNFVIVRKGRKISFVHVNSLEVKKVNYDHILADGGKVFNLGYKNPDDLPSHIDVNFYDSGNKYFINSQSGTRPGAISQNKKSVSLPIVTSKGHAKKIAEVMIQENEISAHEISFTLLPIYYDVDVGDLLEIEIQGNLHKIMVTSVGLGKNLVVRVKGIRFEPSIYSRNFDKNYEGILDSSGMAGKTVLEILDIPNQDHNSTAANLYLAASGYLKSWTGATVYMAKSKSDGFVDVAEFSAPSTMGVAVEKLGDSPSNVLTHINSLLVNLYSGELQSVHPELLDSEANLILVGDEILQFTTAELVAENQYRLHGLIRGRFGTEHEIQNHEIGDRFVLLDSRVKKVPLENLGLACGQEIFIKAISHGNTFGQTELLTHKLQMTSQRPLSVINIKEEFVGENVRISWEPRSFKATNFGVPGLDNRLEYAKELYRVGITLENGLVDEIFTEVPELILEREKFEQIADYKIRQISEFYCD